MPASIKHLTDKKLNLTSLLARWKDGLYYTAAIVRCDKANKRCLVCFEDGSEVWINNRDVHLQLTLDQLSEDEDIVCCICDEGHSDPPNEIILCDVCQQGYHQKCHIPSVDSSKIDASEETSDHKDWFCATCSYILNQSDCAKLSATVQQQLANQQEPPPPTPPPPSTQPPQLTEPTKIPHGPQMQSSTTTTTTRQKLKSKTQSPEQGKTQTNTSLQSQQQQQQQQQQLTRSTRAGASPAQPQQLPPPNKTTIGPVKTTISQAVQKPAPYYPLSTQGRSLGVPSTAALASMTASSALVVGSSSGRTKQDLVNQSNRSSHKSNRNTGGEVDSAVPPPVKHAVRKSSVNFAPPVKQSALPTATRSVIPHITPSIKPIHVASANAGTMNTSASPPSTLPVNQPTKIITIPTQINKDKPSVTSNQPVVIINTSSTPNPLPTLSNTGNSTTNRQETGSKQNVSNMSEEKIANNSSKNGSLDSKNGGISQS